jgi:hypothetical protein
VKSKVSEKALESCASKMAAISADSMAGLSPAEQKRRLAAFEKIVNAVKASRRARTRANSGVSDPPPVTPVYARGRQ